MIRGNARYLSLAIFALMGALAGCGDKSQAPDDKTLPEPKISSPASEPAETTSTTSPLDAYNVSQEDSATIFEAMEKVVRDCMAKKGFTYETTNLPSAKKTAASWVDPESLGLLSAKVAATTGYHPPANQQTTGRGALTSPAAANNESQEYQIALNGSAKAGAVGSGAKLGGCRGEAQDRLRPGSNGKAAPQSKIVLIDQIRGRAFDAALKDSRVKAAKKSWSDCMAKKGYKYANPVEASSAAWTDPPSQTEIDTALSDMDCKREVKLVGTWDAVLNGYLQTLVSQNEAALQGVKEETAARVTRAKAILGGNE